MNYVQRVFERGGEGRASFKRTENELSNAMNEMDEEIMTDGGEQTETENDSERADAPAERTESDMGGKLNSFRTYYEEARQAREEGRENHPRIAKLERELQEFGHLHVEVEERDQHFECSKGNTRFDYNTNEIVVYDGVTEHPVPFDRVVTYTKPYDAWD